MSVEGDAAKTSGHGTVYETIKVVIHALILAFIVRIFLYQPFNIPSGSMLSTLLIGDYIFVSKFSYGYSKYSLPFGMSLFEGRIFGAGPKRGDVAVFKLPKDNKTDYIKRVIGLPGDRIQMRRGILFINGKAVPKRRIADFVSTDRWGNRQRIARFEEQLPNGVKYMVLDQEKNGRWDDTEIYKVPEGHYFMMGDNRDNSSDSRVAWAVGYVPFENFVGRADIIFFSAGERASWFAFWRWPVDLRWSRFFNLIG